MVGALDERQPGDDLRRAFGFQFEPPRLPARGGRHQCQIAFRLGDRFDSGHRVEMRHEWHGEAEVKPRRIPHRGFAGGEVGMDRERRLDVSESGDDDAPDAFHGVERQQAAMALHQPAHHVGLTGRAERRADLLRLLHRNQAVDDVAPLHQEAVDLLVDRVDLLTQILQRRRRGGRLGHGSTCGGLGTLNG
jgi:hypothetical protein